MYVYFCVVGILWIFFSYSVTGGYSHDDITNAPIHMSRNNNKPKLLIVGVCQCL
jgi:hypothetical protein